jgi:hypothetical protein
VLGTVPEDHLVSKDPSARPDQLAHPSQRGDRVPLVDQEQATNGECDLSRMFCFYVGVGRADLAQRFVRSYIRLVGNPAGWTARFTPFLMHDRGVVWEWLQRPSRVRPRARPATFTEYVSSFLDQFQV